MIAVMSSLVYCGRDDEVNRSESHQPLRRRFAVLFVSCFHELVRTYTYVVVDHSNDPFVHASK